MDACTIRLEPEHELESRLLMTSIVLIGALPSAQQDLAERFGPNWAERIGHVLNHLDIDGVVDVEFDHKATNAYGWIETTRNGQTYLGLAQGSAPQGGRAAINLALADQFGIDPLRVMLHEVTHLLQPRLVPNNGHVNDHRSIMYAMGVPTILYASYGIDPERPYVLTDADRATYESFWRSFTPFVMPSLSLTSSREGHLLNVSIKTMTIGMSPTSGVVTYPNGRIVVDIPRLGPHATWSQQIVLPANVHGMAEFSVENARSAAGTWPRRVIPAETLPVPDRVQASVQIIAPTNARWNELVTVTARVTTLTGTLVNATLTVASPAGTTRIRVPELSSGQQWDYRWVVRSPNQAWNVSATLNANQLQKSADVRVNVTPSSSNTTRRPWTSQHASLFATLRALPLWRNRPASEIAEEVHRQLGTS